MPERAGPDFRVPALLEYLPYRKRDMTRAGDETRHAWFAGHGYASARVDLAGSGDSFGVQGDEYSALELADGEEVVAWLARQPWCAGEVGMFGISWGGFNSLQIAARRPPALKAIVTSCSTDDRYANDMHYSGGCLLNDNLDWGTTFMAIRALPGDPEIMGPEWRANWMERLDAAFCPPEEWMRHQTRDDFWRHGSVREDYSAISCAVFAVGGWLDGYSDAIPRLLANLEAPRLGLIGPHAHQWGQADRAPGPAIGFLQEMLRFWDHWLKGEDTGIMREPMLRVWMQEDVPARPWYAVCPGRWVGEERWPSPRIATRTLHLNPEGLGRKPGRDVPRVAASPQTLGLSGGEWCPYGTGGEGPEFPGDQRFDDGASLCFDGAPLARPLEILGAPVAILDLRVDKPVAFVCVRLNDVKPDGSASRAAYAVFNLTHREGHDAVAPLEPGRRYRVRAPLSDTAYRFRAGHRLRVAVSTSYWPMVWPSPEPVELTLHTGTSAIELPVRPARGGPRVAPFAEPEEAPATPATRIEAAPSSNVVARDVAAGRVEVAAERGSGLHRIEEHGLEFRRDTTERAAIVEDDPLSAETETVVTARMRRGSFEIDVRARTRLRATRDDFLFEADLDVWEGRSRVLARTWSTPIARHGI